MSRSNWMEVDEFFVWVATNLDNQSIQVFGVEHLALQYVEDVLGMKNPPCTDTSLPGAPCYLFGRANGTPSIMVRRWTREDAVKMDLPVPSL